MPPTIRTTVDALGNVTAIETYQGAGWVTIAVAPVRSWAAPVIQRGDVADLIRSLVDQLKLCRDCYEPWGQPDHTCMRAWLWRAWAEDRSRICDCGVVCATTEAAARTGAWVALGGPWRSQVVEMQVEAWQ